MDPDRRSRALEPGTFVGNNEVLRKIASGATAEIYLVRVTGAAGFEKIMVLKRIRPGFAEDPRFVAMFLDAARLAATLRHPNIAAVIDVGEADGSYFITREYVHGQDLQSTLSAARARNELLPLPVALVIVHAVANALHHAHEKLGNDSLVRADVSSTNIMLSYDGAVKLLDLGFARDTGMQTQTGSHDGKVPYMSPEACRSRPLDWRSDLFSLGVIMFELTVGRRPFRGLTPYDIMEQIVRRSAPRPSELVEGYPEDLEAIVMRLLAPSPDDRHAHAQELLQELDVFITNHEQWISSRAIGRYIRELFADDVEAWEHAQQKGVPFAEHIASTMTSETVRSQQLTPEPATSPATSNRVFRPMRPVQTPTSVAVVAPTAVTTTSIEARLFADSEPPLGEPEVTAATAPHDPASEATLRASPPPIVAAVSRESSHADVEQPLEAAPAIIEELEAQPSAPVSTDAAAEPSVLSAVIEELAPPAAAVEAPPAPVSSNAAAEPSVLSAIIEELVPEPSSGSEPAAPVAVADSPDPAAEPSTQGSVLWGDLPSEPANEEPLVWNFEPSVAPEPVVPDDVPVATTEPVTPATPASEEERPPPAKRRRSYPARQSRPSGALFALFILLLAAIGVLAFRWLQDDLDHHHASDVIHR